MLDQLFVKMQEVRDMYLSALDDESEIELGMTLGIKMCFD